MRAFAIVPAAGHSVRMGRRKLTLPWGNATILDAVLHAWCASHIHRVAVVVRKDDRELRAVLGSHPVDVVCPESDPPDMKASIRAGLTHLRTTVKPEPTDIWLVAPADMPLLPTAVIDTVVEAAEKFPDQIVVACHRGQRAHPTAFPWSLAEEVDRLPESGTLRDVVAGHSVYELACDDERLIIDIDTPEDFSRALRWIDSEQRG